MSIILILLGLMILAPSRGRAASRTGFVMFVLVTGIHAIARGLDFDTRFLWW